jgi:hypothetical protein
MGQIRNKYKILVRKSVGKWPLRMSRGEWKDNIQMHHKVIGWDHVEKILLVQSIVKLLVLVNKTMNLLVQNNLVDFLSSYAAISFSRKILLH